MTTQTIDKTDQIEEFNQGLNALVSKIPNSSPLANLAAARPRMTTRLVQWMNIERSPHFTVDQLRNLVEIIEAGGDVEHIDPAVRQHLAMADELDRLCQLYAEIHNVPRDNTGVLDWSKVSPIDKVTTTV